LAARRKALRALSCSGAGGEHHGTKHVINMGDDGEKGGSQKKSLLEHLSGIPQA